MRARGRIEGDDLGTAVEHGAHVVRRRRDIRLKTGIPALDDADDWHAHALSHGPQIRDTLNAHTRRTGVLSGARHRCEHVRVIERGLRGRLHRDDQPPAQTVENAHTARLCGAMPSRLYASSNAPMAGSKRAGIVSACGRRWRMRRAVSSVIMRLRNIPPTNAIAGACKPTRAAACNARCASASADLRRCTSARTLPFSACCKRTDANDAKRARVICPA